MFIIRRNIFETNSSSTHSLVISYTYELTDVPSDNQQVVLVGGEFGWGPNKYTDWQTKANYLAQYCFDYLSQPYIKSREFEMLEFAIMEYTHVQPIVNFSKKGYIDHQSSHVPNDAFTNIVVLKNFLFNSNSVLIIDHD